MSSIWAAAVACFLKRSAVPVRESSRSASSTTPPEPPAEENYTDWGPRHGFYKMGCTPLAHPSRWALSSNGPDLDEDSVPIRFYPGYSDDIFMTLDPDFNFAIYDPTNGTVSNGDVWRLSDRQLQ